MNSEYQTVLSLLSSTNTVDANVCLTLSVIITPFSLVMEKGGIIKAEVFFTISIKLEYCFVAIQHIWVQC